jgi:hypothetical protein
MSKSQEGESFLPPQYLVIVNVVAISKGKNGISLVIDIVVFAKLMQKRVVT